MGRVGLPWKGVGAQGDLWVGEGQGLRQALLEGEG